jgi:integrase
MTAWASVAMLSCSRRPKVPRSVTRRFTNRIWKPTLEQLKLPAVGIHVLRHSAAARMIQSGASPKAVQSVVGHASAAFTLTVYGHMFDEDLDTLANALDSSSRGTGAVQALP